MKLRKKIFLLYEYLQIKQHYGDFRLDRNYNAQQIKGLSKESGAIRGVIINIVNNVEEKINRVLLPGEYNIDRKYYSQLFDLNADKIVTAGIGDDTDYQWNFEAIAERLDLSVYDRYIGDLRICYTLQKRYPSIDDKTDS